MRTAEGGFPLGCASGSRNWKSTTTLDPSFYQCKGFLQSNWQWLQLSSLPSHTACGGSYKCMWYNLHSWGLENWQMFGSRIAGSNYLVIWYVNRYKGNMHHCHKRTKHPWQFSWSPPIWQTKWKCPFFRNALKTYENRLSRGNVRVTIY